MVKCDKFMSLGDKTRKIVALLTMTKNVVNVYALSNLSHASQTSFLVFCVFLDFVPRLCRFDEFYESWRILTTQKYRPRNVPESVPSVTSVVSGNGDPPSLYTPASLRTSYHPPPWRSHTSATVTHSLYELLDYALLQLKPITLSAASRW